MPAKASEASWFTKRLVARSRHTPFYAAAVAGLAGAAIGLSIDGTLAVSLAASAFFSAYLALTLVSVSKLTKTYLKGNAAASDAPVWLIFLITLGAVIAALISLFVVINTGGSSDPLRLAIALLAVPLGWLTIHIMSAIHYAHLFWQPGPREGKPRRGLEFPGTSEPEGWDFVYFACVIGMTAQTSDVQITGSHMRRFNLAHAIISFFFNTVLVAAAVNVAVSLNS